jgi:hypothetical protein
LRGKVRKIYISREDRRSKEKKEEESTRIHDVKILGRGEEGRCEAKGARGKKKKIPCVELAMNVTLCS